MSIYANWTSMVHEDQKLRRIGDSFIDYKENVIAWMSTDVPQKPDCWILYREYVDTVDFTDVPYRLVGFYGNRNVGDFVKQFIKLHHMTLPSKIKLDVLASGSIEVEDGGEGNFYLWLNDVLVSELVYNGDTKRLDVESDCLDVESIELIEDYVDYILGGELDG